MFKINLNADVKIVASGEVGYVKGRAEYLNSQPQYFIHYKAADGRAISSWFDECDLVVKRQTYTVVWKEI